MNRTRRSFIKTGVALAALVSGTTTAAAGGCGREPPQPPRQEPCNKFDDTESDWYLNRDRVKGEDWADNADTAGNFGPQPGEVANDVVFPTNADLPPGHDKVPEPHDKDESPPLENGQKVGHCKFDPHPNSSNDE
ncbi:twin-arginine translocation signal domain-containing protein [Haladaptatus sp. DYSN1]|uniref:twin-arginine translocation signal domain-containing protein n=1 Tax=unclassified Haladaptatus TaxID=2622732 RepID=UPI002406C4EB|nr:twin-arginine translocation signal domain-containing protein [Haladaptatus sp. DYSN1]